MDRTALINMVKSKIDEISSFDELPVDVGLEDNNPVDSIIENLLDECAKEVLLKAPIHRLTVTSSNAIATPDIAVPQSGTIPLPADFVRLAELKMADWARPVTELHPPGSPVALRQSNKWLRAKNNKPVAILSNRKVTTGNPPITTNPSVIEYYSIKSSHAVSRFMYIKKEVAENIPEWLQDALCWICASKVLTIFNKPTDAKYAIENAVGLLIH